MPLHTFPDTVDEDTAETFSAYFTSIGPTVAVQVHADAALLKMLECVNTFVLPDMEMEELQQSATFQLVRRQDQMQRLLN